MTLQQQGRSPAPLTFLHTEFYGIGPQVDNTRKKKLCTHIHHPCEYYYLLSLSLLQFIYSRHLPLTLYYSLSTTIHDIYYICCVLFMDWWLDGWID